MIQRCILEMTGVKLPLQPRLFLLLDFEHFQISQLVLLANLITASIILIAKKRKNMVRFVCLMSKLTAMCQYQSGNSKQLISPSVPQVRY